MHGAHLLVAPAHGLQRRVIVTQLYVAAYEFLLLIDDHVTTLVVLQIEREFGGRNNGEEKNFEEKNNAWFRDSLLELI